MTIKNKTVQEDKIAIALKISGFIFEREFRFHPSRKWRLDFALPNEKIAIEFEGGVFINGGHNRGVIYAKNCEKYREALILGWQVLRYTIKDLEKKNGEYGIIEDIKRVINKNAK